MITVPIIAAVGVAIFILCAGIWIGVVAVLMGAVIERNERPKSNVVSLAERRRQHREAALREVGR